MFGREHRWSGCYVLLLSAKAFFFTVTFAEIIRKPDSVINIAGTSMEVSCSSNVTRRDIHWYMSVARKQSSVKAIFNGFLTQPENIRFKVHVDEVIDNIKLTKLKINNITTRDAGTVICADDELFGDEASAQIYVIRDKPKCTAICTEGEVLMVCSYCYWGVGTLSAYYVVEGVSLSEIHSTEYYNEEHHCLQRNSYGFHSYQCSEVSTLQLSMTIIDNVTGTTFPDNPIKTAPSQINYEKIGHIQTTQNTGNNGSFNDECKKSELNIPVIVTVGICVAVGLICLLVGFSVAMILLRMRIISAPSPEKKNECNKPTSSDQDGVSYSPTSSTGLLEFPPNQKGCRPSGLSGLLDKLNCLSNVD